MRRRKKRGNLGSEFGGGIGLASILVTDGLVTLELFLLVATAGLGLSLGRGRGARAVSICLGDLLLGLLPGGLDLFQGPEDNGIHLLLPAGEIHLELSLKLQTDLLGREGVEIRGLQDLCRKKKRKRNQSEKYTRATRQDWKAATNRTEKFRRCGPEIINNGHFEPIMSP